MSVTISVEEFAAATIDDAWLIEAIQLTGRTPADAAEAAALLQIAHRAECALSARRITLTAAVADARSPEGAPTAAAQFADLEIAVALTLAPATGGVHGVRARRIHELLPITESRIAQGHATEYHAIRLLELTRDGRRDDLLAACESQIWAKAGDTPTAPELARTARRVMAKADSAAFLRDHITARRDANVRLRVEPGTTMALITAYLPTPDAALVINAISARATTLRAAGDRRDIGEFRAVALTQIAEATLSGPTAPRRHGRPVEIQIIATLDTILGVANTPGELHGYGPIPAHVIRDLARDARHRLLVTDGQSGQLLDYGRKTYRPPAPLAGAAMAARPESAGPGSTTPATGCDLDHHNPWDVGGDTSLDNLIPLDRRTHRAKTHGGWNYTINQTTGEITWTTGFGQRTTTHTFDYRLGP